ncbi:MAG: glutamine-hydrolyzing carbamoyl-phosphate synthase small subunit, partial [Proteobacteria bacterium]|nr:glutamine-hydrolyzing carbamoyl-phosphate synthase small subunit [Pseudomonadota bacterium]
MSKILDNSSINAALIFPDGEVLYGIGVGKKGETYGEICFNTAMTGYQETLSDPSYSGQIITFTFPHIGNVGVNENDIESVNPKAKGLIVREAITNPANYRSSNHLNGWLEKNNITGISGVDTRRITKDVRVKGAKTVAIIYNDDIANIDVNAVVKKLKETPDLKGVELASAASVGKEYSWDGEGDWSHDGDAYNNIAKADRKLKVVAIDFGAKLNILRCLTAAGCDVVVVDSKTSAEEILKHNPDGVFLSNGPGDPAETGKYAIPTIQKLLEKDIAIFGICLGHQLLSLANGAKTVKMQQGHRGANHPVQDLRNKKVEIT